VQMLLHKNGLRLKDQGSATERKSSTRGRKSGSTERSSDSAVSLKKIDSIKKDLRRISTKDKEEHRQMVSFGTIRGACTMCSCEQYRVSNTNNIQCETCDHFPAQHEDKGKTNLHNLGAGREEKEQDSEVEKARDAEKDSEEEPDKDHEKSKDSELESTSLTEQTSEREEDTTPTSTTVNVMNSPVNSEPPPPKKRERGGPKMPIPDNRNWKAETQEYIISNLDSDWLINYSDLHFNHKLGHGVSSMVWKGTYREEVVAIKVLQFEQKMQDLRDFKEELFIMSQLRAPNIVHFYGATLEPKLCIVMELCINGSVYHYLSKPQSEVTWARVLKWSSEVARGINTLHLWKPPLVHRDLKTLNLLLDREWNIKVCDFGLSRYTQGEQCDDATLQKLRGTYAYTAPEMYYSKNYTAKSDVYSMGVVMWELVMRLVKGKHCKPYGEYSDIKYDYQIIFQVAHNQRRPTIPPECPKKMSELIERCWSQDPTLRPTAGELVVNLKTLRTTYKKKKQNGIHLPIHQQRQTNRKCK